MNFVSRQLKSLRSCPEAIVFHKVFQRAECVYAKVNDNSQIPSKRTTNLQTYRNNVSSSSPREYYKCAIWFPLHDSVVEELRSRFSAQSKTAIQISHLLPPICSTNFATEAADAVFGQYASFIDDKHTCHAEFRRWRFKWEHEEDEKRKAIDSVTSVMQNCDCTLFSQFIHSFQSSSFHTSDLMHC